MNPQNPRRYGDSKQMSLFFVSPLKSFCSWGSEPWACFLHVFHVAYEPIFENWGISPMGWGSSHLPPPSHRAHVRKCDVRKNSRMYIPIYSVYIPIYRTAALFRVCIHANPPVRRQTKQSSLLSKGKEGIQAPAALGWGCFECNAVHTTACAHREDEFPRRVSPQNHPASHPRSLKEIRWLWKDTASVMFLITEQIPSASYCINIRLISTFLFCFTLQFTLSPRKNSCNRGLQGTSVQAGVLRSS